MLQLRVVTKRIEIMLSSCWHIIRDVDLDNDADYSRHSVLRQESSN